MAETNLNPGLLVIYGITGDLVRRKLLPALYQLLKNGLLPEQFEIIGVTRRGIAVDTLVHDLRAELAATGETADPATLQRLGSIMRVVTMDVGRVEDYHQLKATLDDIEDRRGVCLNRLFYLSIPPQAFGPIIDALNQSGLTHGCQHGSASSRLMIEKPFGYDLASAEELIARLKHSFAEEQIYRIDHYLAKETVQNILTFRLSNPVFEAVWNRRHIRSIHILAAETIGIEGRAAFYEANGALRDFAQNHLLQLLALTTMELPPELTAKAIHRQKLDLMQAINPITPNQVARQAFRAQYAGYTDEVGNPDSVTETFARLELAIDNERWEGVPITLTTGKNLDQKTTEISLEFARTGREIDAPQGLPADASNVLTFRLQPNEGIELGLWAKAPGFEHRTESVAMTFDYHHRFGDHIHPDPYERVLIDGIRGDQTLFATSNEILASWKIVEAVVREWSKSSDGLQIYQPGTSLAAIVQTHQKP